MRQTIAGLLCLGFLAFAAGGQETASAPASVPSTAPVMPKPEPVLQHIPADAVCYLVVNDIGATMARVDGYMVAVGLNELIGPMMPNGAMEAFKAAAMLGEGFNPAGGFAAVLLDGEKFGVDLVDLMGRSQTSQPASQPASQPQSQESKVVPFVLLIPGSSVQAVFSNYEITEVGKYAQVALRMGPMLATQLGGYVCLAPSAEILDAVVAESGTGPTTAPSPERDELLARADIAVHANMAKVAPLLDKIMAKAQEDISKHTAKEVFKSTWAMYMGFYQQMYSQMTELDVAARFTPTGLVLEGLAGFKADSPIGRSVAAFQPSGQNLLDRLADLSYVLAVGSAGSLVSGEQDQNVAADMTDKVLAMAPFSEMDEQSKADLKAVFTGLSAQQGNGVQMVIGGAPEGSGVFGASMVIRCKDSAAVKELLLSAAPLIETVIKTAAHKEQLPFQIAVSRGLATVDDLAVDAVEIVLDPNEMSEQDRAKLALAVGEEAIRFRLVAVDPQTVVITFGGAQPYLAEALKVAKAGDGAILSDPSVADALAVMPQNPNAIALLNVGNLFEVIGKALRTLEDPNAALPFRLTSKVPVAFGSGVWGGGIHVVWYVPNELVKEGVDAVKALIAAPRPMPTTSPQEEGGF
jgi:hypothetical protein